MFILTQLGNLVPLTNVKGIRRKDNGSIISLISGQNIPDPRTPKEVAESISCGDLGMVNILVDNIKQMENYKRETQAALDNIRTNLNTKLAELKQIIQRNTDSTTMANDSLNSEIRKIERVTEDLTSSKIGLDVSKNSLKRVIDLLVEATEGDV